ncbi:NACHT domain-containing protein [Mesorhizobium sp. M0239]|uniref:NACHT domain-containing protein n=1 Tax=Mesorhizobium sp. M0239 TaxID=2956924 RepID=UPI003336EA0A
MTGLIEEGGTFAELLGTELSKKASGSLAGAAISLVQSLGKAAWKTVRSSRARRKFQRRWSASASSVQRQQAIRQLLTEDPKRAQLLSGLLLRLDFLRAVAEHAEQLPNIGLLDATRRLSEVYVPLKIRQISDTKSFNTLPSGEALRANSIFDGSPTDLLHSGNHLVEGAPGAGKTTLARWLVAFEARSILEDRSKVAFEKIRLPVLVTARSLQTAQSDFAAALHRAVNLEMSLASLGMIPNEFFLPYSESGHKSWLIIIDGLDEVEEPHERQHIWDVLTKLHSQAADTFRFIVFTRPNAVRLDQEGIAFQRWSVCSPTESDRRLIAKRYITQSERADQFLARLGTEGLADAYRTPLFEAIAASIFSRTGFMPRTRVDLCEAFVSALIDKSTVSDLNRPSIIGLLSSISERTASGIDNVTEWDGLISPNTPRLEISFKLNEIILKTGLARYTNGSHLFIHDIFRSYFFALKVCKLHEPTSGVWRKVDPFSVGWTTVQYICEIWEQTGKDISIAVRELLHFGDNGEICGTEVCISCSAVNDKVAGEIADRIIRDMYSTGATISGLDALSRLATHRAIVLEKLVDCVYSDRDLVGGKVEFANCILSAGHLDEALEALVFIAESQHEYHGDRIRAAELLCENGRGELGREVLAEMAKEADELWMRAEAAVILFQNDRSDPHRKLVAELFQEEPDDNLDRIFESTIARLLSFGDEGLALPAIRGRAKAPTERPILQGLSDQIAACKAIADHHDRGEAVSALKLLLSWEHISLRNSAEVLEALADVGAEDFARNTLLKLIGSGPTYEGTDWFVLKLLARLGLEVELRAVGFYLLRFHLEHGHRGYASDIDGIISRLSSHVDRSEIAHIIRYQLQRNHDTRLASSLATLGFRDEACGLLKAWGKSGDLDLQIDAARTLCLIGERDLGLRSINRLIRDGGLGFEIRLRATDSLERVNELDAAKKAYTLLLNDKTLSMSERCRAAQHFDWDGSDNGEAIWEILLPHLFDDHVSLEDRIAIADTLLRTASTDWGDFDRPEVIDELFSILEASAPSPTNAWNIISILAENGLPIAEIPRALELADDISLPVETRIEGLQTFLFRTSDGVAANKLLEIAKTPDLSYDISINALSTLDSENPSGEPHRLLSLIVGDPMAPPKWRLKAASEMSRQRGRRGLNEFEVAVICDPSVSVRERVGALLDLKQVSVDDQIALLKGISATPRLDAWGRLSIAEAALQAKAVDFVRNLLRDALLDTPCSTAEMVKMAELYHAIGESRQAISLLERIANLADNVLAETEDHSSTIEAATLLAKWGRDTDAKALLLRLVRLVGWRDLTDILDCIGRLSGEDEARQAACELLPKLVAEPNNPSNDYMFYWRRLYEEFLANGWTNELSPLLIVVQDSSKLLSDRAEAAATIYRNSFRDTSRNWASIAQGTLIEFSNRENLSAHERANLVAVLNSCDLGF